MNIRIAYVVLLTLIFAADLDAQEGDRLKVLVQAATELKTFYSEGGLVLDSTSALSPTEIASLARVLEARVSERAAFLRCETTCTLAGAQAVLKISSLSFRPDGSAVVTVLEWGKGTPRTGVSQRSYRLILTRDRSHGWRFVRLEPGITT